MNPDTGKFESLHEEINKIQNSALVEWKKRVLRPNGDEVPNHWSVFEIDELIVIKNYTFRVKYIGETSILFEPLSPEEILEREKEYQLKPFDKSREIGER